MKVDADIASINVMEKGDAAVSGAKGTHRRCSRRRWLALVAGCAAAAAVPGAANPATFGLAAPNREEWGSAGVSRAVPLPATSDTHPRSNWIRPTPFEFIA